MVRGCARIAALLAALLVATAANAQPSVEAVADDETVKWTIVAKSNHEEQRIPWSDDGDHEREDKTIQSVCALDMLHLQVQWRLPPAIAEKLLKRSRRLRKNRQGTSARDIVLSPTLEVAAVHVDGAAAGFVVATSKLPDRSLAESLEDGAIEALVREPQVDTGEQGNQELRCEFDPDFCSPKIIGIRLPNILTSAQSLERNHTIVLEFEQPTNQPIVATKSDIDRYIQFTEYLGDEMVGNWIADGQILEIRILEIDTNRVEPLQDLMEGLLRTSLRVQDEGDADTEVDEEVVVHTRSQVDDGRFRIEPHGLYFVRLSVSTRGGEEVVFSSRSPLLQVKRCDDSTVVLSSSLESTSASNQAGKARLTPPSFFLEGILTHAGQEGYILPHSAIQMEAYGSWSMSFWMLSTQDSTGKFRTLFFNGDGSGEQRTPSAWWKPDERKLVLRVSTNASLDIGMDNEQELPLNEWVHMGFTFRNCSAGNSSEAAVASEQCTGLSGSQRRWFYSFVLYINGAVDKEILFYAPALANMGPLHIGKGPWTDGMQGFISNLRTFPKAIAAEEHRQRYLEEKDAHLNFPSGCEDRVASSAASVFQPLGESEVMRPAIQISHLLQRALSKRHAVEDAIELKDLQAQTYHRAQEVLDSCDPSGWDILIEAAELGHPGALYDLGVAHFYGSYEYPESCAGRASALKPISVKQDLSLSQEELEAALTGGSWGAGKYLALLASAFPEHVASESAILANLTIGLHHLAAMAGRKDAYAILARRYAVGDGVPVALDIGVYHYYHAAVDASAAYHERGKQPLHEMNRLYDGLKEDLTKGQLGDDDELIQFQKLKAGQGDIEAMAAMGELYYWGARGLARDHVQAHNYFSRAANAGHVSSQSALAGMLLKGEGATQDNESAIMWYGQAAEKNHTRALNGLGFIHFYGSGGVAENKSLALEFFERAAANEEDGDSVFNAGYCHAFGLGTPVNFTRAIHFYEVAAKRFGHFDAIYEMGKIWMVGIDGVIARSNERAYTYLKAASEAGRWGKCVRKGFDRYLNNDFQGAAVLYHEAREYGYPVATSNLAFLYDQKLLTPGDHDSEAQAFRHLKLADRQNGDKEVLVRIGDYHFYGLAGLAPDFQEAVRWYSRASAEGVDVGAYSVGYMHEYGIGVPVNLDRAERYYRRVLALASGSTEVSIVVRLALVRLALRKWTHQLPFAAFAIPSGSTSQPSSVSTREGSRLHFSELGGIGLESIWAGWSAFPLYSIGLTTVLAVAGIVYICRSA